MMFRQALRIILLGTALLLTQIGTASASFDPTKTVASGSGTTGGYTNQQLTVHIQCFDSTNTPMNTSPGATWTFLLTKGTTLITPSFTDNGDGTLSAVYTATVKGGYIFDIKANGTHIMGSPFGVNITGASAANSTASGPGVTGGLRLPGLLSLTVTARDDSNNLMPTGGDNFTLEVYNTLGIKVPSTLVDNLNATYSGQYPMLVPGIWTVIIKLNGVHIQGSPFHPLIL